jgi:uncharacterized Fe-S center protein
MPSTVYFASAEVSETRKDMVSQVGNLFEAAGGGETISEGDLVAIKLSFSEVGNTACLRAPLVRPVVRKVKDSGGTPFLTDANTLYVGGRSNSVDHVETAIKNGFAYAVVEAPVIIADGLRGKSYVDVRIDQKNCKTARIGAEAYHADALISLAHVHCHGGTGLAATFKNIGMGLGSRSGKQAMHSQREPPSVDKNKCVGDAECVRYCPVNAIRLERGKARIDRETCIRCGECTVTCPHGAIAIRWGDEPGLLQERIVEYTAAVLKNKKGKCLFYAFLLDVVPDCLCISRSDRPFVPNVGILASRDPVALEQASFDTVNAQPGLEASRLTDAHAKGADKFRSLYPGIDSELTMAYAEKIGLGSRKYEIKAV